MSKIQCECENPLACWIPERHCKMTLTFDDVNPHVCKRKLKINCKALRSRELFDIVNGI